MKENGGFEPPALKNRKRLPVEFQFHWDAFRELGFSERPEGMMGLRPIPIRGFLGWADLKRIPEYERNDIWEIVTLIDKLYLEAVHKRQPKPQSKEPVA